MTISNKTAGLILATLSLLASGPTHAAGYRRSSYGGGGRRIAPVSRGTAGTQTSSNHNSIEAGISSNLGQIPGAPVRGRGMVGYGATTNRYGSSTAGYASGSSRGFGSGLRSFGSGGSRFAGSSYRSVGTRYEMAPAGDTGSAPAPTSDQPVQGFAVPGALIRTAGLEHYYNEPSQPAREHVIAAGTPKIQDNLAYNDSGPGGVFKVSDKLPTVNPGWGSRGSVGGDGGTPNSVITGTDGNTFGGTKPNDPSNWNENKGNGNGGN